MSDSHEEKKPAIALNPAFHDPLKLAELVVESLKSYLDDRDKLPMPSPTEIEQWSLSESELDRCAKEFVLMSAIGSTVTVKNNKPFEFYSAFIRALTPRLSQLMFGYHNVTLSEELIHVIEKYIHALDEGRIVEASCIYTERVFSGNPKEGEIFAANLWTRAFDLMNESLTASRNYFLECMADEQIQTRGKQIIELTVRLDRVVRHMEQPDAVVPKDECYAIIQEVGEQWKTADTEPKRVALLETLKTTYDILQTTMHGEDVKGFAEYRDQLYKALLLSEVMIGTNVSTAKLVAVTNREISSVRMKEDHELRKMADMASAVPYLSDEELYKMAKGEQVQSTGSLEKAITLSSRIKQIRSFLRLFGC
jgi:hypothetical protein